MSEHFDYEEFGQGRRAPFTMLGDWVAVSGVDPNARSLYWDVKAHVNENRGTNTAWPPRDFLALLAGGKQPRTQDPYMRQLEAINAIGAERERNIAKMRSRNLYKVHDTPPPGWDGPSSHAEVWQWLREDRDACQEYYADRRAWLKDIEEAWSRVKQGEKAKGAKPSAPVSKEGHRLWLKECRGLWSARRAGKPTSPRSAVQRTTGNAEPDGRTEESPEAPQPQNSGSALHRTTQCGTAHLGSAVERTGTTSKGNKKEEDAASPRSGVDGRSPSSAGSSARAREGGFAASSEDQSHPKAGKPAKHTREQLALVEQVRAFLPEQLAAGTHVPSVSDAILKVLDPENPESRTVEQLGSRIQHRWVAHGYISQEIRNPISVVTKLVQPYGRGDRFGCPNPRCEDGVILETGEECTTCVARIAERRAEARRKASQEAQQDAPAAPEPPESGPAPAAPQAPAWETEADYYPDLSAAGAGDAPDWAAPADPVIPQQPHDPDWRYGGDAARAARQAVLANKGLVR